MGLNSATLLAGGLWLAIALGYAGASLHDWWEKRR